MLADYVPVFNAHVVDLLNKQLNLGTKKSALTGVHTPRLKLVVHQEELQVVWQVTGSLENQQVWVGNDKGFKPTWGRIYGVIPYARAFTRNVRDMAIVTENRDMTSSNKYHITNA